MFHDQITAANGCKARDMTLRSQRHLRMKQQYLYFVFKYIYWTLRQNGLNNCIIKCIHTYACKYNYIQLMYIIKDIVNFDFYRIHTDRIITNSTNPMKKDKAKKKKLKITQHDLPHKYHQAKISNNITYVQMASLIINNDIL